VVDCTVPLKVIKEISDLSHVETALGIVWSCLCLLITIEVSLFGIYLYVFMEAIEDHSCVCFGFIH
jgi:hypothetical protein